MTIRDVLQLGNRLLRTPAARVADPPSPQLAAFVDAMRGALAHWWATTTYGRGIAAPQLGWVILLKVNHPYEIDRREGRLPWIASLISKRWVHVKNLNHAPERKVLMPHE